MLWNFVMDSFLDKFSDAVAKVIGYADDGALVIGAADIGFALRQMQMASEVGLTFSIAKTKAVIFSRRKNPPTLPTPLLMNGILVEVVEEFKYLGLILDSRLEWTSHITPKSNRQKSTL
jgi:hypothetical protein